MKLILNIFAILFISYSAFAEKIATVRLSYILNNSNQFVIFLDELEKIKTQYFHELEDDEKILNKRKSELEDSKLILSEEEINKQIEDYNNQLSQFSIKIEEFNFHYQNEIIKIREIILKEILKLLEEYALENSVDLVLDSTTYLIASNSLDITIDIKDELDKLNLNLEYKDFEKN